MGFENDVFFLVGRRMALQRKYERWIVPSPQIGQCEGYFMGWMAMMVVIVVMVVMMLMLCLLMMLLLLVMAMVIAW